MRHINFCFIKFKDKKIYKVRCYGKKKNFFGNLTYNNSNLGYQEIITDPSYYNQVLLFLTANVGNTGINNLDFESYRTWIPIIIVNKYRDFYSNYKSECSLKKYIKRNNSLIIETRKTREIMEKIKNGLNEINVFHKKIKKKKKKKYNNISTKINYNFSLNKSYKKKIIIYDMGLKTNILRLISKIKLFPLVISNKTSIKKMKKLNADGVIITNGPGDPRSYKKVLKNVKYIIKKNIPIMGICLGHQIISLAMNKEIILDKKGQHGANYSIIFKNKSIITTQNHNYYAVNNSKVINLIDGKNQGFIKKKIISFQGHPEACPGTNDCVFLFKKFKNML
ncbi:carbamoyl phosphate synthase small subunit [Candidatus Vidania fulgoroideorum]